MKKAIIIGSGIAGIASSIRLAVKGYEVDVYEANPYPGGKLNAFNQNGYRFDAGPSLFTMPHFVDELFLLAGKNPKDYFSYQKMDEACRYFYEDGTRIFGKSSPLLFAKEIENKLGVPRKVVEDYFAHSKRIYNTSGKIFLEKSLHKANTWLNSDVLKALMLIPTFDLNISMDKANRKRLKHPKLVQLFNRFATYNGSSPYLAPGILNVIPHLEHGFGTFFPNGGMHSITLSLVKLAEDLGVKFYYNNPVDQILVERKMAVGIVIKDQTLKADLVVSNMDIVPTYKRLLKDQAQPERTLRQPRSSSALIFYFGITREFSELGLHNIFFSENYQEEFRLMFEEQKVYHDPTVYIHISSKIEKSDAPEGCENWFVMINVPGNTGQDWEGIKKEARSNIIKKLSRILNEDIENLIDSESVLDPIMIEQKTSSYHGSLYGAASNNQFAAFLRHPNFSKNINNLYFCGGSVHPGGGIPLCLLSAKVMVDNIK